MAGMPKVMMIKQKKPPKVGDDADNATRVANNGTTPSMPDRDGPAKRHNPTPKKKTSEKAKGMVDIKSMKKSLKGM